ncbi:MAG: protein kinase [Kofleriaceae bacterium]
MATSDLEGIETLPPDERPPRPVGAVLASWDRYEVGALLGQGGMGAVYRARDRQLDRMVAIKLILGADPKLTMRLVREARAQARIEHPNVCRVHEVGEVEGRAYIALQLVEGVTLHQAAARMSLEDKVSVMRDVAAAIHEAHRHGVVHRDVKPANILVELTEDGRWFPVVMDFGLARETAQEVGLTRSGALVGTPSYMSPEQARGDGPAVDRRSDIYGLGATCFELWTGRPPFAGPSLATVLAQVIHDEPPAPRSVMPSLPVDLETITLKCLAKDPARRYGSARALAEDLGRYLDGEPIVGRREPRWQRVRRRARRHRVVVGIGGAALVIIAIVTTLGVRTWIAARAEQALAAQRVVLAQQLGQDARDIELFLRSVYQLPLQDTRPARAVIRGRMTIMAATPRALGPLGDAVVHAAIGRGHLALHEWQDAADELAKAAGLGTPELHAARGQALGELYRSAMEEARRSGDRAWLAARQHALAQQYLAPAVRELAQSRGAGDHPLLEALLALDRGDFVAAEAAAIAATAGAPWLLEAYKVAGDAAAAAAADAFDHGNYDAARPGLVRAAERYGAASEIARSDASIYEAAARAQLAIAELDFRQGRTPRAPLDHAVEAIDRALRAEPDNAAAHTTRAYILFRRYRTPALRAPGDQRPLLAQIAQAAARAVALDPRDANAWDALGNAYGARGTYEVYAGGDGVRWWRQGIAALEQALAIRPGDPWVHNDLGVIHRWLGSQLEDTGQDPMPEYDAALRGYDRAAEIDPGYVYACSNQADLHASIAGYQASRRVDPAAAAERARQASERCLAIDPQYDMVLDAVAAAQLELARYLLETGGDAGPALTRARRDLDRADARHPANVVTRVRRLVAAALEARARLRDGVDPTAALGIGRAALRDALQLSPGSVDCYVEATRLDLVEAAWAAHLGRSPRDLLARARRDAEQAVAADRQFAQARVVAAAVYLQLAAVDSSTAVIERGLAYADEALAIHPRLLEAEAVRAALAQFRQSSR